MKQTVVLAILDGWGVGPLDESNPIYTAELPTISSIEKNFPCGALQASGLSVGLPWEEEGNSEVGHLTIGTGSVFYQHYPKISLDIERGGFFSNPSLTGAFQHAEKNKSAVHLIGLLSKGNVHSSLSHIEALLEMASQKKCTECYIHIISDGRDSPPESVAWLIEKLNESISRTGVGTIVSVVGRYYAMNRDEHWDRTKLAYDLLTRPTYVVRPLEDVTKKAYAKGLNDEFLEPAALATHHPIQENDAIIFFNFREDSMRQLVSAFVLSPFSSFPAIQYKNIFIATMTDYFESPLLHVAYPNDRVGTCLGKILSDSGKVQLRIAETQKYAHVTYFMNGLRKDPFPNEYRILIPSLDLPHPEQKPEMMATAITDRALLALHENTYDCIIMNYANPDILAHTGNYNATIEAVRVIDREIQRLMTAVLQEDHILLITSDHGNAEIILNINTGEPETKHNVSPVPFYVIGNKFKRAKPKEGFFRLPTIGILSDIAPTILELLKIQKPPEMTGQSLLSQLQYL